MKRFHLFLFCAVIAAILSACKTTEIENASERPWNSQRGWETGVGLPSTINQGK